MTVIRKTGIYSLFILLALLPTCRFSFAQSKRLDPEKWAKELSKKGDAGNEAFKKLDTLLLLNNDTEHFWIDTSKSALLDSTKVFQFLDELAKRGKTKGYNFWARFNSLKAKQVYFRTMYVKNAKTYTTETKEKVKKLLSVAIDQAYRSEDDNLIAFISLYYGQTIYQFGELGLAVMYVMNGIDMYEKLSYKIRPSDYQFLAELLYRIREYKDCIKYGKKAVTAWQNSPNEFKPFTVSCINTVALGYHRRHLYDSALIFYKQALQLAEKENILVWVGIVSGNMGQIYYEQKRYDTAYTLLIKDYRISNEARYYDNAANSLQWAARANLARGNKITALAEVREAFELLKLWPDADYLKNTYYTASQIFRQMNSYDSAFYYNNLYSTLNDSLEKIVSTSSIDISRARLNDETSRYNIQILNREKRSQLMLRNIIIAGIIMLSLFALLMLNRNRLKTKLKMEKAEQEKLLMELDFRSAKEQLEMFTSNIIEKTNLIEKLELQAKNKQASSEQQAVISELSNQTILTEEDWMKFRSLYEKIYPGFFIKLKEKFPGITLAEQRMASLTRLQLTAKQMASMLGISPNSVNKTKRRLRLRFNLTADESIEKFISEI